MARCGAATPRDILALHKAQDPQFNPKPEEMDRIARNRPDFLGVNYYSPSYVRADPNATYGIDGRHNPDPAPSFNGPIRLEYLTALLRRIREEYGNPPVLITENGAGFGDRDEAMGGASVRDPLRADYIRRHVEASLQARRAGSDLRGYFA